MQLDHYIRELLFHHDRAFIPGLGGFVTEYRSARIDRQRHWFHPPSKAIVFNQDLSRNDGLLADLMAQKQGVSYDEALKEMDQEVSNLKTRLQQGKRIELNGVGILFRDQEGNLQFHPDDSVNLLKSSFGLASFYAPPIGEKHSKGQESVSLREGSSWTQTTQPAEQSSREKPEKTPSFEKQAPAADQHSSMEVVESKGTPKQEASASETPLEKISSYGSVSRKIWWAAAILIPFLLYAGWVSFTSDVFRSGSLQVSDLNPLNFTKEKDYKARKEGWEKALPAVDVPEEKSTAPSSGVFSFKLREDDESSFVVDLSKELVDKTSARDNTYVATREEVQRPYHVVGGCFEHLENAKNFTQTLREIGFQAVILEKRKGLHPVAFGSFNSKQKALKNLSKARLVEENAWVLQRN